MTSKTNQPITINPILGILLLFGLAILSIPCGMVAVIFIALRERRLFRRLASTHRTIPWCEVEQHLAAGRGTLIIEQAQKQSVRLWWTPDDIPALSPCPPPAFADLDFIKLDRAAQPFVAWCFQRYLSLTSGSAFLSRPNGLKQPGGFVTPEFFYRHLSGSACRSDDSNS
jgi:hypothetical protein